MFRNKLVVFLNRISNAGIIAIFLLAMILQPAPVLADSAGYSLYFDGVNDYVDLGFTHLLMGGTSWQDTMSFSLWVKPEGNGFCLLNDPAQCDSIFGDRPRWWGLSHGTVNGLDRLWVWNYDTNVDSIGIPYTPDVWVNIAWVHAGGMLSAYKNGVLVGSIPSGTTSQPPGVPKMQIGAVIKSATENWSFNGQVDELRIYDIALSENDILSSLFSELNGNEAGLRAYYKMSNGSGSVLTDDSVNSFDGTLVEESFYVPSNGTLPLWMTSTAFDKPLVRDFSSTTDEDVPAGLILLGLGSPSSSLTYTVSDPPHGSLSGSGANRTYTPDPNFFGSDSFTYQAWDGANGSASATVSITVNPINDAPFAINNTWQMNEDSSYPGTLSGSDADGDNLTYIVLTQPSHGTLSGTVPNLTYTPQGNYFGSDAFTFKVNDSHVDSNIATITLTVNSVNDVPTADDKTINTPVGVAIGVTLTGSDVENSPLTFAVTSNPSHGGLSGTPPNLTYTPAGGFSGSDSFAYTASDGQATSPAATVTINVTSGNAPPIANNQSVSTNEDTPLGITLTGSDPESQPISYIVLTQPAHGTLSGIAPALTYHPAANYFGNDSFTFKVNDTQMDSNSATISITVNAVNDAPIADNQSKSTDLNQPVNITLTGSDVDNDPLIFTVATQPQHGALSGTLPNLTYTPDTGYSGADSFTYRANDGNLNSSTATVSITIGVTNLPPTANGQDVEVNEDGSLEITLSGSDPEGQPLTYAFNVQPTHGSLLGIAPNMTYQPQPDFNGSDFFIFRVRDGVNWSEPATVNITVLPINDAPRAISQPQMSIPKNTFVDITLSGTDIDGDALSFEITVNPLMGTLGTINPVTNVVRYTPNPNYVGADVFRFRASDGQLWSSPPDASISIVMTDTITNSAPQATVDSYLVTPNSSLTVNAPGVLANDTDANSDPLTAHLVTNVSHGTLVLNANGSFVYTPSNGFLGTDTFSYYASDSQLNSNTVTVSLNVVNQFKVFLPLLLK